ncbi:tripartite tricarboxylate transporter TctB family protein [Streptomyces sp. MBT56]|uniref:tripartite tricarboxylate transporter TctB family protein n=1 Tax=unclassified Streptomyces TaxID=2593676 RepID=UPI00190C7FA5|nr:MULTISPECIES: tripartite tricarboxylate transporter TctB family protein [unclassified Streptomyces]MBK3555140.1 tripartite tricarboxylate transporter TctB family protein [Streptomyces sp. MBT56]MBK3603108.1 tripartite tricarboxylate transporter TctB family protein [Streptomyces sp. MBT54]MBK3615728.1 tripartite tricarboxylate transporter TctB family protein [Streptomyces sp. MBT98]
MTTEPTEPAGPTGPTEPAGPTGPAEPAGPTGVSGGGARAWLRERSELGVSLLLFALGVLVLTDALTMDVDIAQRGPIGPRTVPFVVGAGLLLVGALLAVDVLRGGRGEAEGGEDVDLDEPADWRTVLLLTGVFLGAAVLIGPLGFPIAGALLFWGAAYALGSRHHDRDPLIAAGLSLFTYFVFDNLLGVPLPGGPLMGVL